MNPGKVIYKLLSEESAITAIVGDRISPILLDEDSNFPAILYTCISHVNFKTINGNTNLMRGKYQIDCFAESDSQAMQLAELVQEALDSQKMVFEDTDVQFMTVDSVINFYDAETQIHRYILDLTVHFSAI